MCCEVRVDRRATEGLLAAGDVHDAGGERKRLPGVETRRQPAAQAPDGYANAGADPGHSPGTQRQLRLAAHGTRTAWARIPGQQAASRTADALERHSGTPQAALQSHDGFETRVASSTESA